MTIWDAIILGIVEGLTEFLPVSSTGHLTITSKLLGQQIDDPAVTAFTAVIQFGAIAAVVLFMWKDISRYAVAWFRGLRHPEHRGEFDHRMGWFVIVGSLPICVVGFLARDIISGPLRSMWWVAGSLIVWSFFMVAAERLGSKARPLTRITLIDAVVMGLIQCLALIPGVSRSGATITAGLFRGLDRVASHQDGVPARHPGAGRRRGVRVEGRAERRHRRRRRCSSARWSASSSATRRWPGCSASWPSTRRRSSPSTGSCSASSS